MSETTNYTAMEGHELHTECGVDAAKWAEAFRRHAVMLGYSDMDLGWLIGWFANPIMVMHDRCMGTAPVVLPDGSAVFVATIEAPSHD